MKTRFLPAVAATVITAGVLAVPSLAQDTGTDETTTESTESESSESTTAEDRRAAHEANRAEREARYNELLAGELGVSVDDLVAARESVKETLKAEMRVELEARLAERVETGDITQERADEILAAFDAGERPFRDGPGRRGHHGPRGGFDGGSDQESADTTAA